MTQLGPVWFRGSLLLALVMWAGVLASCGDDDAEILREDQRPDPVEEEEEEQEDYVPPAEGLDPSPSVPDPVQLPGQYQGQGPGQVGQGSKGGYQGRHPGQDFKSGNGYLGKAIPEPMTGGVGQGNKGGEGSGGKPPAVTPQPSVTPQPPPDHNPEPVQRPTKFKLTLRPSQDALHFADVLWVVDNSSSMKRLGYDAVAMNAFNSFVQHAGSRSSSGIKVGLVSATSQGAPRCVPAILERNSRGRQVSDFGFVMSVSSQAGSVTNINCRVESLSSLLSVTQFIQGGQLAGRSTDGFFRAQALKMFVVISDDPPLQAHVPLIQNSVGSAIHPALTGFSTVSSATPQQDKVFIIGQSNKLTSKYADYRERVFLAKCGNLYSESLSFLTRNLGGIQGHICRKDQADFAQSLMNYIRGRQRSLLVLDRIAGYEYSIDGVLVDGLAISQNDYEIIPSSSAPPLLWIKNAQLLRGSDPVVSVLIQTGS